MNQVILTKKLTKKYTNFHQTSIQAVLNFLETQKKTSSAPSLSICQVALKYEVAEQTLCDAIAKGSLKYPGSSILLIAEEENELVGYCLNMQSLGFKLTKEAINTIVVQMLATKNKKNLTKNGPTAKANPIVIQNHFATLEKLIYENCLTPDRIWNIDESRFNIFAQLAKVIVQKGIQQIHKTAAGNSKEHISICSTILAAEMYILPLLIYKGVKVNKGLLISVLVLPGTITAFTKTGYMHKDIFRMYIKHFSNSIFPTHSVLLILDRATIFGEAFHEIYTPNVIRHAFIATGIWPLNSDVINSECLMLLLAMFQSVISSPKPTHECNTRNNRLIQLENKNKELSEYIQQLEHPRTTSLASIMKYP
ncbi:14710_t:CDS:2 [Cetraspora pellucida]|uniref:14710_t:CDS:1 n=1 Tax=Cetraspora pellucida TaxID=1433469 RepID=A0A9N9D860_9GLOM|nr:14710_t:CDS:2 [Cetraspora pellucida]